MEAADAALLQAGAVMYCYFCSLPLTGEMPATLNNRVVALEEGLDPVVTRCPHAKCKKPLPQCAICLMPLYVVSHAAKRKRAAVAGRDAANKGGENKSEQQKMALPIDSWVTWCQSCHHGGHMSCLTEWFAQYGQCPVADCECRCAE